MQLSPLLSGSCLDKNIKNTLCNAVRCLSMAEKRLMAISLIQAELPRAERARNVGVRSKVRASDFAAAFDLTPAAAYQEISLALQTLSERAVEYDFFGERGIITRKFRWISGATRVPTRKFVEFNFSPEVTPHMVAMRQELALVAISIDSSRVAIG